MGVTDLYVGTIKMWVDIKYDYQNRNPSSRSV